MKYWIICTLFFCCTSLSAQRDTARATQRIVYWPNGKIREAGRSAESGPIGEWNYYDSTGQLIRREWYSFDEQEAYSEWYDGVSHLDSTYDFGPYGERMAMEAEVRYEFTCAHPDHSRKTKKQWKEIREKRVYYDSGQLRSKTRSVELSCAHDDSLSDTLETKWYASGQIAEVVLNRGEWYRFYTTGALKAYRSSYLPGPRNGRFLEMDSTGKVLFDRTYVKGKLAEVHDSAYYRIDQERVAMATAVEGFAVMSLFPRHHVTGGDQQHLRYYNTGLPEWSMNAAVPAAVIDSVTYTWAGVLLALPETSRFSRDSMLKLSQSFHPSGNVWYYTLTYAVHDDKTWLDSCRNGRLFTENPAADSFFSAMPYRIMSFTSCNAGMRQATVVIATGTPINFIAFHKALHATSIPVTLYCGALAQPEPEYRFQLMRNCGHSRTVSCTFQDYKDVLIMHRSPYGGYDGLMFNVNSDQTVDFLHADFAVYGLGIHVWEHW